MIIGGHALLGMNTVELQAHDLFGEAECTQPAQDITELLILIETMAVFADEPSQVPC